MIVKSANSRDGFETCMSDEEWKKRGEYFRERSGVNPKIKAKIGQCKIRAKKR